jgi:LPS O-antigen subunit length determinant protein (WzzB/FepE family)
MVDVISSELSGTTKRELDLQPSFGWELLQESWKSWRFIMSLAAAGLIAGGLLGYNIPQSYTVKLELTPSPIEKYDRVFSAFYTPLVSDENQKGAARPELNIISDALSQAIENQKDIARPELKIISDALSQAVYDQQLFLSVTQKTLLAKNDLPLKIDDVLEISKLSPGRGLEKYFVQGYSVKISLKNKDDLIKLTNNYSEQFKISVNENVKNVLGDILNTNSKLNDLKFEILSKKHKIDLKNKIEDTGEAIDIAKIGGFAKPIMPQQMPVTAQIPLQDAVPPYFFGYEVLEQEKKQLENNANNETKIDGYSDYFAESNRLAAMSNFIASADLNFVDVQIFPEVDEKYGLVTKLALMIGTTILLISFGLFLVTLRIIRRKIVF